MSKSSAKRGLVSGFPMPAQMKEFWSQVDSGKVTKEKFQAFLRGSGSVIQAQDWIAGWQEFYQKHFGMAVDFSGVRIPEHQAGFDRLIVVAQGLTLNQVYDACAKQFPCWRYTDDLDKAIIRNDRDAKNGSYAVWFRDRQEADEELKGLSADQLAKQKILGITLLERLLYGLKYFDETGQHLDLANWTYCTGSRNAYGHVPDVYWGGSRLHISWLCSGSRHDGLRSRAAVP